jgi:hypothetical protein
MTIQIMFQGLNKSGAHQISTRYVDFWKVPAFKIHIKYKCIHVLQMQLHLLISQGISRGFEVNFDEVLFNI